MKLILLGAPGAGKGTQAERIAKKLNIPTISTGFIIRQAISAQTDLGKIAKDFIDKGQLVPDEVVIKILFERIKEDDCKNGFILDGFPRTIPQAEALVEADIRIDKVLSIELEDEVILDRLSGRRECSKCGKTFHVLFQKPQKEGICDVCGGELICRKDDNPETIKSRLSVYHKQTEPLIAFYKNMGILAPVESKKDVEATTKEVFKALGV
ncbi:MAG: adenylate kinase [Clostridia bacterium]|nr:adenylate kinase [Clostridia bacterium]